MADINSSYQELESLSMQLAKLEKEIYHLKHNRDEHNLQVRNNIQRRNELHEKIKSLLSEAYHHRDLRNSLNSEVQRLKKLRSKLDQKISSQQELVALLEAKKSRGEDLSFDPSYRSHLTRRLNRISRSLQNLEWRLQTEVLSIDEEKAILRQIETLSSQRAYIKNELRTLVSLEEANSVLQHLLSRRSRLSRQIANKVKESQIHHKLMEELFSNVKSLRDEANRFHNLFLWHKRQGDIYHNQILSKIKEKQILRERLASLREKLQYYRNEQRNEFLQDEVRKVLERYNNGEKISLEEFRLLVEKGLI